MHQTSRKESSLCCHLFHCIYRGLVSLKQNSFLPGYRCSSTSCNLNFSLLKRIPKSARIAVANKLSEIIEECVKTNEEVAWHKLMTFSYYALRVTNKSSKSLSSVVKKNLNNSVDPLSDEFVVKPTSNLKSIIKSKIYKSI